MSKSERIWQSTTSSTFTFPRELEIQKIETYQYGLKKFVEEFKQLAFEDDSWVIVKRNSILLTNRSSSVPPRR